MDQPLRLGEAEPVIHLLNLISVTVVFYAGVTRGGLAVARVLERLVRT